MIPRLSIPTGSQFKLDQAIELLTLTGRAQDIHARFTQGLDNDWQTWHSRDNQDEPMSITIEGYGTYQVHAMLERAQYMWGRRKLVPFGFIAKKNNRIYVVFRGTATRAEWVSNLKGLHKDYSLVADSGESHRGFLTIYTRPDRGQWWSHLWDGRFNLRKGDDRPAMSTKVETLLANEKKLMEMGVNEETECFVTGHSLGGALATLAALHISKVTGFKNPILYAFANPRAGDGEFASAFRKIEAYRIFNSEDLVPTLPLPTVKLKGRVPRETKVEQEYKMLGLLPDQSYTHIGDPIAFTDSQGTIPANHVIASYLNFLTSLERQRIPVEETSITLDNNMDMGLATPNPA